ncbi:hypothetical protein [Desulfatibacillum aliphaticivorans]|uniref:hypothetical protein n=1 Tax=Desulfatibacillum aliphaticivorans TaxID=218208 RepID=UPI000421AF4A|nr:hypothetical protein [Desulfatibacillum aliphaticivorans]
MGEEIQTYLQDHQKFASQFQLEHFVAVKNGGTAYGRYRQVCREIAKRSRSLKQLDCERRILLIDMEELEAHASSKDNAAARKSAITLEMKQNALEELDASIAGAQREMAVFKGLAAPLKAEIGELTDERRNELEAELWEVKLGHAAVLDVLTTGRVRRGTMEAVLSLPDESRDRIVSKVVTDSKNLLPWMNSKTGEANAGEVKTQ